MQIQALYTKVSDYFQKTVNKISISHQQIVLDIVPETLRDILLTLRDHDDFKFNMLIDIAGVDYLHYGQSEWETTNKTATGFDRGVQLLGNNQCFAPARFASVYQLLSLEHNVRIRIRCFIPESTMMIDTVTDIWPAANWYEREAFDLFGIVYIGHPDLRRLLTDYGFIGHPFRKNFPLSGHVEVRYDAKSQRVIYEPVMIQPRVLVPKVIRKDNRYIDHSEDKRKPS